MNYDSFSLACIETTNRAGATEAEVIETVQNGEQFPTKFGRTGFRKEFRFSGTWRGRFYKAKQIEAFAVPQEDDWLVITVVTRYY